MDDHAYDPLGADDCEGLCMPALVGSSFAGALLRAIRQADPPLTLDDLILISYPLTDEDVASLLLSRRLPEADEVAVLADVMGMTLDELLECQRIANRRAPSGRLAGRDERGLVPMKLRVAPEVRTALRLRKATTGRDMGEILRSILEAALVDELAVVRGQEE